MKLIIDKQLIALCSSIS